MVEYEKSLVLHEAGRMAESMGKLDKARRYYGLAVTADPGNPAYIQSLAYLARRMGEYDAAQALFREAIEASRLLRPYPNAAHTALVCESLTA